MHLKHIYIYIYFLEPRISVRIDPDGNGKARPKTSRFSAANDCFYLGPESRHVTHRSMSQTATSGTVLRPKLRGAKDVAGLWIS